MEERPNPMKTEYHRYRGVGHAIRVFVAWGLALLFAALSLAIVVGILTTDWGANIKTTINPQTVCDGLVVILGPPVGVLAGLALANMFPTVGINSSYLTVSFCFCELKVPWEDVVDVTRVWYPVAKPLYAVRVKRLTPLHSIFYGSSARPLSFRPTFLISSTIDDFDELMKALESNLERADSQSVGQVF
jgi:hypothetical protein